MSVAPGLVDKIIGADKRKGLGELIGQNTQAYTDDEFYGGNTNNLLSLGAEGTYTDSLLRNAFRPIKVASDLVSNVPGALSGIGQYMGQKSDDERQQDAQKIASNMAGLEFGLPTDKTLVKSNKFPKGQNVVPEGLYDAFDTEDGGQGQKRLVDTQFPDGISIQDVINSADKGTTDGTDGSEIAEEENNITKQTTDTDGSGENLTAAQTATKTALSEFLAQARPGVKPQKYDEYIKEFGDATGLDISGEPDTKQALMSFGLALMQNRAGKGFDISKILTATGEAGEAAMPDFRKAVAESKAVRAKAGEYALGKTKEDKNAAMNRKSYMIVPKGKKGGLKGLISGIGKGEYTQLNSYELNNLALNKEFNEQYEIVPSSTYADLAGKAITASTKTKKLYQTGKSFTPLFTGAPKGLGFNVQLPDANEAPAGTMPRFIDNPDIVVNQLVSMDKSLNRQEKTFANIAGLLEQTGVGVPSQLASSVVQGFRNLGLDVGGDTTPIAQIKTLLTRLKAENAAEILGEAGKTLSDNDRKMVSEIVGEISLTSGDEDELVRKVGNLYKRIITAGRENVAEGYRNLSKAGVNINRKSVATSKGKFVLGKDNIYDYTQTGE